MDDYQLIIDLHKGATRQGPGGDAETEMAMELAGIDPAAPLRIADIGCGTGASALCLARTLNARITAVDFLPEFVDVLNVRAENEGLSDKIDALVGSMDDLAFEEGSLDVIWSEGAIYNMGFEHGVKAWRRFLKPGGLLVVSEITWTTPSRPLELEDFWKAEYPEIGTASSKMRVLEESGYAPVAYFVLPERCWVENYYGPLQGGFDDFLARNGYIDEARALVEAEKREIALYNRFKGHYSYGVYIARKSGNQAG